MYVCHLYISDALMTYFSHRHQLRRTPRMVPLFTSKGGSHGRDFHVDVGINHPDVLESCEHHNICTVFPHVPGLKFNPADPFHRL